jgi:hypothetical protein
MKKRKTKKRTIPIIVTDRKDVMIGYQKLRQCDLRSLRPRKDQYSYYINNTPLHHLGWGSVWNKYPWDPHPWEKNCLIIIKDVPRGKPAGKHSKKLREIALKMVENETYRASFNDFC